MINKLKQTLMATATIVFTACGGGSGTSDNQTNGSSVGASGGAGTFSGVNSGKKLKKITTITEDKVKFTVTEYTYNSNDLVEKIVKTFYDGDSEQGTMTLKSVSKYTYEKIYNVVKIESATYGKNDKKINTSTSSQTYNDDKIVTLKITSVGSKTEVTFSDYEGFIAKKAFSKTKGASDSESNTVIKVTENKASEIKVTSKMSHYNGTEISSLTYDSLDRVTEVSSNMRSVKFSYDNDKSKIEPKYTCFGGYVKIIENHRTRYSKAQNTCYLATGKKQDMYGKKTKITYVNTVKNGLVTKRIEKEDDKVTMTYTYEYE